MLRVRFYANYDDSRPVNWPIEHPYWESGFSADGAYSVVVAYADHLDYIKKNWPEADQIEILEEADHYTFTDRFPRPKWFQ